MGFLKSLMSVISTDGKTGTPFKLDKNHTVYYKGNGVTKLDAAHVAGFLHGYGYFIETNQSYVQISSDKSGDAVQVGYIIGSTRVSLETEKYFKDAEEGHIHSIMSCIFRNRRKICSNQDCFFHKNI